MRNNADRRNVDICKALQDKGLVVIKDFLSHAEVSRFCSLIEEDISKSSVKAPYPAFDPCHIHDLIVRYPEMLELLDSDEIDAILSDAIGAFWTMYACTSSSIPPGGKNHASRIHCDSARFLKGFLLTLE